MSKIPILPVPLGPDDSLNPELHTAFYPLGCLTAYAKAHAGGSLPEAFTFGPVTPLQAHQAPAFLESLPQDGGVFLLSSYVWNHALNMSLARELKRRRPASLIVVGGPHIPRAPDVCEAFFRENPQVDVAARHEGEVSLAEMLETIRRSGAGADELTGVDLSGVLGLTFRRGSELVRTPDRPRTRDLEAYPSPYTTGEYDHWLSEIQYLPLETNRGCPYGCTFCDWGAATLSKLSRMSMDRVFAEIEFAGQRRVKILGICDANFGILPRDVEIAQHIVEVRERYGYPRSVSYTNAKVASDRLIDIVKILRNSGLIVSAQISMQTTDEQVLRDIARANIKTSEYRKMIAAFHADRIPIASDMMLGLPGQTLETCRKDLQFFFDHKVMALLFHTSIMPNAPMASDDYRRRYEIVADDEGMVQSTYSFDRHEYSKMFELCLAYKLFVKLGVLKYLLYFIQIEHGVKALDFIQRWLERVNGTAEELPLSRRVKTDLLGHGYRGRRKDWLVLAWQHEQARFLFDAPEAFYREVIGLMNGEFGLALDGPEVDAILAANGAVLPRVGRTFPFESSLSHDVPGYFAELQTLPDVASVPPAFVPLALRGPGCLTVTPTASTTSYAFADLELLYGTLELASNLRI